MRQLFIAVKNPLAESTGRAHSNAYPVNHKGIGDYETTSAPLAPSPTALKE